MFVDKTVHRPTGSGRLRPGRGRGRPVEGADEELEEELASTAGGARQVGRSWRGQSSRPSQIWPPLSWF